MILEYFFCRIMMRRIIHAQRKDMSCHRHVEFKVKPHGAHVVHQLQENWSKYHFLEIRTQYLNNLFSVGPNAYSTDLQTQNMMHGSIMESQE